MDIEKGKCSIISFDGKSLFEVIEVITLLMCVYTVKKRKKLNTEQDRNRNDIV